MVSSRELVSHVVRRASMGAHPDIVARLDTVDAAITRVLDLSGSAPMPPEMAAPTDRDSATRIADILPMLTWWLDAMATNPRLVEERMIWFWHDHFATSLAKVRMPYTMWRQHLTVRAHALGDFRELLHAMSIDPAMLTYLDGTRNHVGAINENYAREVMELHTVGRGNYSQADITEAAKACSGWVARVPFAPRARRAPGGDWDAVFIPARHVGGTKTILGRTDDFDLAGVVDLLLEQPATSRRIAAKIFAALVGVPPGPGTAERLGASFAADWRIDRLVTAIVTSREFVSEDVVRNRVRSPVEKLVALRQAVTSARGRERVLVRALRQLGYVPFAPPNPAGYPRDASLLGPSQMMHTFDLLNGIDVAAIPRGDPASVLARFGVYDASPSTLDGLGTLTDPTQRFVLAFGSPEVALV